MGVSPRTLAETVVVEPIVREQTPLGSPGRSGVGTKQRVISAAVAGVLLLGAILFSIKTPNGEIIVNVDGLSAEEQKQIEIKVSGNGEMKIANEANGWTIGVKEGKYSVELTGGSDQMEVKKNEVTVTRRGKAIVTVSLKPNDAAMSANTPKDTKPASVPVADPATERRIAEWVLGVKGLVTVRTPKGESLEVSRLKDLPKEPFTLTGVNLSVGGNYQADEISNDDCRQFAALSGLESLNLGRQQHVTAEGLAHFSGCRDLKLLGISNSGVGVDAIPIVTKFTKLEAFDVPFSQCDIWAEALAKMPTLRKVVAYRTGITDAGVAHLARLPKLEDLNLVDADISDASLKSLATCKSLKSLEINGEKLTWPEIKRLQQALPDCKIVEYRLVEFYPDYKFALWLKTLPPPLMFDVTLEDGGIQRIEPAQPLPVEPLRVHYLYLQGPAFDQPGDAFLDEFAMRVKGQRITGLELGSPTLTSERVARLAKLPELSDVSTVAITGELVDDKAIEALAGLHKLSQADLRCPKLTGKGLRQLSHLTGLSIHEAASVTAEGLEELAQLPKFYSLTIDGDFHKVQLTERHIDAVAKLKLTEFLTDAAGIDDALLTRLSKMETLQVLILNKSPITDIGLPELKKLKGLANLSLVGTKVTAAGIADLQQALPKCKIEWDGPKE